MKQLLLIIGTIISIGLVTHISSSQTITHDGNYVSAYVDKTLDGSGGTLVIQSTTGTWKREVPTSRRDSGEFTPDSKSALYKIDKSTLCILTLATDQEQCLPNVGSYRQPTSGTGEWLAYQLEGLNKELVLRDLWTGREERFKDVTAYSFSERGGVLLLGMGTRQESHVTNEMQWVNVPTGESHTIWSDANSVAGKFVFDSAGSQLAFLVQKKVEDKLSNAIWYYNSRMEKAERLVDDGSSGIESGLIVGDDPIRFSPRGSKLFFKLQEKELIKPDARLANVPEVWSYLDAKPYAQQVKDLFPHRFATVVSVFNRQIIRLEQANEIVEGSWNNNGNEETDDFVLICHFDADVLTYNANGDHRLVDTYSMNEWNWNKTTQASVYLVSTNDGSRTLLAARIKPTSGSMPYFRLSPDERFVVYYDATNRDYFSYELATRKARNLTKIVRVNWNLADPEGNPREYFQPRGVMGWIAGGNGILVPDTYTDVWRVDLFGRQSPANLTNGFARRNNVSLTNESRKQIFNQSERILLQAQRNWTTARFINGGCYRKALDVSGDPEVLLEMGGKYDRCQKAANAEVYLAMSENAREPLGVNYTRDFRNFTPVTSSQPERRMAVEQELITWKTFDGTVSQGILLKPPDFDPRKKYPVIFYYYEKDVLGLFGRFLAVGHSGLLIEDGYLLFAPDINYTIGNTGPSVYNSVVSAAKFLARLPFVDAKHMGIVSGSFGGYETNYLVTHSHIFAAAISGCGWTDLLSEYGTEDKDEQGISYIAALETGQARLGVTPWERLDLYIKNSPIVNADKVTTPLLLAHSSNDHRVPFSQSVELFTALRRLGKPVWLLDYGTGHCGGAQSFDTSDKGIRYKQFFDHYLKGSSAPRWMTRGIPAKMKGIDNGLELDTEIKTPPARGLLMEKEAKTPQQKRLLKPKVGQKSLVQ